MPDQFTSLPDSGNPQPLPFDVSKVVGRKKRAALIEDLATAPSGEIVTVEAGLPVTTTLVLAAWTRNEHASVMLIVRKWQADFEEFGLVRFEIAPRPTGQHGGSDTPFAYLNEDQATLLITYLRNNDVTRAFKVRLVKAFRAMREQLAAQSARPQSSLEVLQGTIEELVKQDRRVSVLETKLDAIETQSREARAELLALPAPVVLIPSVTTRTMISRVVRSYCLVKNANHQFSFNRLYSEYRDRFGIDLKKRASHQKCSAMDIAEALGRLDELYAVAIALFGEVRDAV